MQNSFWCRSRRQPANAAKSASLLAAECNRLLTQKQEKVLPNLQQIHNTRLPLSAHGLILCDQLAF